MLNVVTPISSNWRHNIAQRPLDFQGNNYHGNLVEWGNRLAPFPSNGDRRACVNPLRRTCIIDIISNIGYICVCAHVCMWASQSVLIWLKLDRIFPISELSGDGNGSRMVCKPRTHAAHRCRALRVFCNMVYTETSLLIRVNSWILRKTSIFSKFTISSLILNQC